MAECPVCGSHLQVVKYRWITNVIGLTKPYFICPACDWRMTIKEVKEKGSLTKIANGLTYGNGFRGGGRNKPRRHRHHRGHHHSKRR